MKTPKQQCTKRDEHKATTKSQLVLSDLGDRFGLTPHQLETVLASQGVLTQEIASRSHMIDQETIDLRISRIRSDTNDWLKRTHAGSSKWSHLLQQTIARTTRDYRHQEPDSNTQIVTDMVAGFVYSIKYKMTCFSVIKDKHMPKFMAFLELGEDSGLMLHSNSNSLIVTALLAIEPETSRRPFMKAELLKMMQRFEEDYDASTKGTMSMVLFYSQVRNAPCITRQYELRVIHRHLLSGSTCAQSDKTAGSLASTTVGSWTRRCMYNVLAGVQVLSSDVGRVQHDCNNVHDMMAAQQNSTLQQSSNGALLRDHETCESMYRHMNNQFRRVDVDACQDTSNSCDGLGLSDALANASLQTSDDVANALNGLASESSSSVPDTEFESCQDGSSADATPCSRCQQMKSLIHIERQRSHSALEASKSEIYNTIRAMQRERNEERLRYKSSITVYQNETAVSRERLNSLRSNEHCLLSALTEADQGLQAVHAQHTARVGELQATINGLELEKQCAEESLLANAHGSTSKTSPNSGKKARRRKGSPDTGSSTDAFAAVSSLESQTGGGASDESRLLEMTKERDALLAQVQQLEQTNAQLNERMVDRNYRVFELEVKLDQLSKSLQQRTDATSTDSDTIEKLKENLASMEKLLGDKHAQIKSLKTSCDEKQKIVDDAQHEVAEQCVESSRLREDMTRLTSTLEIKSSEYKASCERANRRISELTEQVKQLERAKPDEEIRRLVERSVIKTEPFESEPSRPSVRTTPVGEMELMDSSTESASSSASPSIDAPAANGKSHKNAKRRSKQSNTKRFVEQLSMQPQRVANPSNAACDPCFKQTFEFEPSFTTVQPPQTQWGHVGYSEPLHCCDAQALPYVVQPEAYVQSIAPVNYQGMVQSHTHCTTTHMHNVQNGMTFSNNVSMHPSYFGEVAPVHAPTMNPQSMASTHGMYMDMSMSTTSGMHYNSPHPTIHPPSNEDKRFFRLARDVAGAHASIDTINNTMFVISRLVKRGKVHIATD
jgi:hypothetical protein